MPWSNNPTVPMDDLGNVYRVMPRYHTTRPVNLIAVAPMTCALKLRYFLQTSSSMSVVMEDFNGRTYPMFMSEFEKLVQKCRLDKGVTPVLTWKYDKRGSAYGLCVPEELDNQEEGV